MLALLAHQKYTSDVTDFYAHITNTCVQQDLDDFQENHSVRSLDEIATHITAEKISEIKSQINAIVGNVMQALHEESSVFIPMPNCFEIFGFDFLVDESGQVYILEANAGPDLKNTGGRLDYVVASLLESVVELLADTLCSNRDWTAPERLLTLQRVYSSDHRRKWGRPKMTLLEA